MSRSISGALHHDHWQVRLPGIGWVRETLQTRGLRLPRGRSLERREVSRASHHEVERARARRRGQFRAGRYAWP